MQRQLNIDDNGASDAGIKKNRYFFLAFRIFGGTMLLHTGILSANVSPAVELIYYVYIRDVMDLTTS